MKMRKFLMEYFEPFVGAPVAMKVFQVIAWFCIVYIGITTPILHGYSPVELAMIAIVFIAMTLIAVVAIMSFFWAKEKEDKKPLIFVTIDGDLDPMFDPLMNHDLEEKLAAVKL